MAEFSYIFVDFDEVSSFQFHSSKCLKEIGVSLYEFFGVI